MITPDKDGLHFDRIRLILRATNDTMWDWDIPANDLWISDNVQTLFGHAPDAARPLDWWMSNIHPDDRPRVLASQDDILKGKEEIWREEYRFRRADDTYAHVVDRAIILRDADGRPTRMTGAMSDVTRQKEAEEALRKTEAMYRQILDAIQDLVLVKEPGSRLKWANKAFRDYYGMSMEQLQGIIDSPVNEPDYTQQYVRDDARVFETGKVLEIPSEPVVRHDGVIRHFHTVKSPIFDAQEKVSLIVGVARDVTEAKKLQEMMLQTEKMSAVGQLAAGVAHEVNNPLGVILGFAQMAARRLAPNDPLENPLRSIEREAIRCRDLVQNLLTFSRSSKGERVPTDLNESVAEALPLVQAQAKTRQIQMVAATEAAPASILGNRNQIQQVVINLANNAMDAMAPHGTLTVKTGRLSKNGTQWVCLTVQDSGAGIPPEDLPRIFEPFFTTKPVGKGTGLGLSLVYEIVKKHEGHIEVDSRPGQTVFRVHFPAHAAPASRAAA